MYLGMNKKRIYLYPTDTLYGLGVDATDPEAINVLRALKGEGREGKHFSITVSDLAMLDEYAYVTPLAEKLIEKFLPGKITIVLKPRNLPSELGVGTDEVGVRIPNNQLALNLIEKIGKPITATSANVSGMPTKDTPAEILEQFGNNAHLITDVIDGGQLVASDPSTVVDARDEEPIIIREGAIPTHDILSVL